MTRAGTGKTYASAFAMRVLGFKRILFLVHRGQLAIQTKKSYEQVFNSDITMGLVGAGYYEYEKDYIFATVQTLNKDNYLMRYNPDSFDCIILDEAHHSSASTYQKIMNYFKPKLWLGMTATPDKSDDYIDSKNIYEIFHHQIACEIRLQQAMEEDLLCPFHYFGITDLSVINDENIKTNHIDKIYFNQLVSEQRVKHIVEYARYYGFSGERVKGLVFCSRIDESIELSAKFNDLGYRTIALNGDSSENERVEAFERLAMNEEDATEKMQPLDYIFSVEILNEGVDIVEVNQVIMLRPTQSPIIFIQQLGRGLRKAEGKEYVVILDFIGNYNNNFMIPVALSGDRSYNPDTIRKYVISGNNTIPGESTIHFDEIAKEKIFNSIDKIKGIRRIIKESYISLKNKLGRIPYLIDFYENGEVDPLVIVREYKTYYEFLASIEKEKCILEISDHKITILEYLSKTILNGVRPFELEILRTIVEQRKISIEELQQYFDKKYNYCLSLNDIKNALSVLSGEFVINDNEYEKYKNIEIVDLVDESYICITKTLEEDLQNYEFKRHINDIIKVGLSRYRDKFKDNLKSDNPFVLYEKYSRRDVSFIMNCGKDLSSVMYGMKRIKDDVFIFVTYHKEETIDEHKKYIDGKPDYADAFEDNVIFRWDTQIGRGVKSSYVQDVVQAKNKHLLVKKSDAEASFYYMGRFDVIDLQPAKKVDNKGKERDIAKIQMKMHHAVREDLLRYLESKLGKNTEDFVQ